MKKFKKLLAVMLSVMMVVCMVPAMGVSAEAAGAGNLTSDVETASALVVVMEELAIMADDKYSFESWTVNINADLDMSSVNFVSGVVNGYNGAGIVTVNGNGHTITGLTKPLFTKTWAGKCELIINDLTIADSVITGGAVDQGCGAFVGHSEATKNVTLNNCHLVNSSVTGVDWTGGLIGYAAGYNKQDDGPVFQNITVLNCTVKNCEITGGGSTGGMFGHATGNAWTKVVIGGGEVSGNKIVCTDDSYKKAGILMGTVGIGEVAVNTTTKDNEVTSGGTPVGRLYGRFGSNGSLSILGGDYYDTFKDSNETQPDAGTLSIEASTKFAEDLMASAPAFTFVPSMINFATTTGEFDEYAYFCREARAGDEVLLKVSMSDYADEKTAGLDYRKITVKYETEGAVQISENFDYNGNPLYKDGIATKFQLASGLNNVVAHVYYNGEYVGSFQSFYAYVD